MSEDQNDQTRLATSPCQFCERLIEFDSSGYAEGETQTVICPFCQCETTISAPLPVGELPPVLPTAEEIQFQRQQEQVAQIRRMLRETLESGRPAFLYDSVYVPVNSVLQDKEMADGFDLSMLRRLGMAGWEIVQAVPRTIGVGLTNMNSTSLFGEEWGGGIGGNVAGVHIIIRRSVSLGDLEGTDDEVGRFILRHLSEFCSE